MSDVHIEKLISAELAADILSITKTNLKEWVASGKINTFIDENKKSIAFNIDEVFSLNIDSHQSFNTWEDDLKIRPLRDYNLVELFAGAGGLALGLEQAGLKSVYLNEKDKDACATLKLNRPEWNVACGDIKNEDFSKFKGTVDIVSGGFPCQAFSYAGNKLGFEDTRGTLFFEFARAIKEISPKVFIAENVRGLLNHDNGKTLSSIKSVIDELGYHLVEPRVLKAIFYKVPQKRERLILVAIRKDLSPKVKYFWPAVNNKIYTLRDALKGGSLFDTDVPESLGQNYPEPKKKVMDLVPEGGYWKDLPDDIQRSYMKKSYFLGGGKTGMARRLAWDQPSLTLTCAPAQNQTERCHPDETRPLKIREYARIQTFPDDWAFSGSMSSVYKQIGNAVPVNLSLAIGRSLVRLLNHIELL
jgi:DNA (cytosine-5)-methyltransferase 1